MFAKLQGDMFIFLEFLFVYIVFVFVIYSVYWQLISEDNSAHFSTQWKQGSCKIEQGP